MDLVLPFDISNFFLKLISLLIIITISVIFVNLYFSSKDKYLFILVALFICLAQILFIVVKSFTNYGTKIDYQNDTGSLIDTKYYENEIESSNVYYLLLDGLTSYNYLSKNLNVDLKSFKEFNNNLKKIKFSNI